MHLFLEFTYTVCLSLFLSWALQLSRDVPAEAHHTQYENRRKAFIYSYNNTNCTMYDKISGVCSLDI